MPPTVICLRPAVAGRFGGYFNDDGQRLAAVVIDGERQMVVVDGVEGNRYDTVLTLGGGRIHFSGSDRFHYLAAKGGEMYLVEEGIQR